MGREIRRVPTAWKHPMKDDKQPQHGHVPLLGRSFSDDCREWDEEFAEFAEGADSATGTKAELIGRFIAEHNPAPTQDMYMPEFGDAVLGFCVYENVSEGTPMSPVFATEEELVAWLVNDGGADGRHSEAAARAFVKDGWAPSFVLSRGTLRRGIDAAGGD